MTRDVTHFHVTAVCSKITIPPLMTFYQNIALAAWADMVMQVYDATESTVSEWKECQAIFPDGSTVTWRECRENCLAETPPSVKKKKKKEKENDSGSSL